MSTRTLKKIDMDEDLEPGEYISFFADEEHFDLITLVKLKRLNEGSDPNLPDTGEMASNLYVRWNPNGRSENHLVRVPRHLAKGQEIQIGWVIMKIYSNINVD